MTTVRVLVQGVRVPMLYFVSKAVEQLESAPLATVLKVGLRPREPFLEGPEKFSHPESLSKISNLMITELFYSMIVLI